MKPKAIFVTVSLSLLAGCNTTRTVATDAACGPWRAISYSSKDTPQTVSEVQGNNARRAGYCGAK